MKRHTVSLGLLMLNPKLLALLLPFVCACGDLTNGTAFYEDLVPDNMRLTHLQYPSLRWIGLGNLILPEIGLEVGQFPGGERVSFRAVSTGRFIHLPVVDLAKMSAWFRQRVIAFFLQRKLLNKRLARSMVDWTHSGFSVDGSVRIPVGSLKAPKRSRSTSCGRPFR